jgi:hypothetical protein
MLIDENKKVIFVTPYKTGSHTLGATIKTSRIIVQQHATYTGLKRNFPDLYDDVIENYTKYFVVRNPWSHAVSHYMHCIEKKQQPDLFKPNCPEHKKNILKNFNSFVKSKFYIPQSQITFNDNLFVYDLAIKFEKLNEEMEKLCSELNIEYKKWNQNTGTDSKKEYFLGYEYPDDYRTMYDEESIDIVRQKSENEINYFGYKFN